MWSDAPARSAIDAVPYDHFEGGPSNLRLGWAFPCVMGKNWPERRIFAPPIKSLPYSNYAVPESRARIAATDLTTIASNTCWSTSASFLM
jgi:hypothetical protein